MHLAAPKATKKPKKINENNKVEKQQPDKVCGGGELSKRDREKE